MSEYLDSNAVFSFLVEQASYYLRKLERKLYITLVAVNDLDILAFIVIADSVLQDKKRTYPRSCTACLNSRCACRYDKCADDCDREFSHKKRPPV